MNQLVLFQIKDTRFFIVRRRSSH